MWITWRIIFFIKYSGYYIELLTLATIKVLAISKSKILKYENGGNVPVVVLIHCNIVNNDSQRDSRVLDTFVSNKSFCHLLGIFPKNYEIFI